MKRKREEQFVDMDECLFTTKNIELYTLGVSTCIALVIRGYFYNDDDQKTPFCGLWHWSGFNPDEGIEPDGTEVLNSFFEYAEKQLEFGDNAFKKKKYESAINSYKVALNEYKLAYKGESSDWREYSKKSIDRLEIKIEDAGFRLEEQKEE